MNNGGQVSPLDELWDELRDAFALVVNGIDEPKMKKRYADIIRLYDLTKESSKAPSIGVYGCPKMGKSTLLNSLLGDIVLPTSPIPSTSMVINIYRRTDRKDYEINCYEPSMISKDERSAMTVEEWESRRRGTKRQKHFPNVEGVHDFLVKYASHDGVRSNFAEIEVRGPFENADPRLKNFILRDTPGAEAVAERAISPDLQQDSRLALQSIGRTDIHLFCVSCKTLAGSHDKAFYDEYFRERSCIHVLTHRDKLGPSDEEMDMDIKREFSGVFQLDDWDDDIINELVLTGKKEKQCDFISMGKEELINAICNHYNLNSLCKRMAQIARSLLDERVRHPDWSPIKDIPEIHFTNLRAAVDRFMKQAIL